MSVSHAERVDPKFDEMTFQIVTSAPITVLNITPVPREVRVVDTKARLAWRLRPRDFVAPGLQTP